MYNVSLATVRMAGCIQKSTDVMHSMQALIKLPEIRDSMMELSKEMSKVNYNKYTMTVQCTYMDCVHV